MTAESQDRESAEDLAPLSDAESAERFAALVLCRTALSPSEAILFREMFPQIVATHHDSVWNQLRRRGLAVEDVEDIIQEVFLTLFHRISNRGFPDSMPKKLHGLAKGRLLNFVRRKKHSRESPGLPSSRSEKPASQPDMEQAVDLRNLMQSLLPRLDPVQREVAEMVIRHGLSTDDVASVLDLPEGTVKTRLMAAKRALLTMAKPLVPESQRATR